MSYTRRSGGRSGAPTPSPESSRPVALPTQDHETRVSPTIRFDDRGRPYQEIMEKASVGGINIDVDREGGVFLDHDELAKLLETGNIDDVITRIRDAISTARARYQQRPPADFRWNV